MIKIIARTSALLVVLVGCAADDGDEELLDEPEEYSQDLVGSADEEGANEVRAETANTRTDLKSPSDADAGTPTVRLHAHVPRLPE